MNHTGALAITKLNFEVLCMPLLVGGMQIKYEALTRKRLNHLTR
jgi:hypothetical protein